MSDASDWPVRQQDFPPGALVEQEDTFYIQYQDEEGRWIHLGGMDDDRDRLTRTQAYRVKEYPEEKRRVIRHVTQTWIEEVEGDGEGETSQDALLARNEETTKRIIEEEDRKKKEFTDLLVKAEKISRGQNTI
jgi:hypothetical protein